MKVKAASHFPETGRSQVLLRRLVSVILWAVLFTLAYAQSPLYTSNQNQYFLHGLAKAGWGNLDSDWLAKTLDPTPVFSALIYLTSKYLPWPPIFYLYYSLLAGIYIFSLYGLLSDIFHIKDSRAKRWFYLAVLFLIHSAALRYLVVRIFNPNWAYLFDGGVAGQRLLGSVLQPSTFGVLFVLSIFLYLRGKTYWAVLCLVLAPTVHPTYLLGAGILTLVYMGLMASEKRNLRDPLILGGTALLAVTPTLVQALRTFGGTGKMAAARSRELLVTFRIPHHAIPAEWFDGSVVFKVAVILFALYLTRKTRFFHILCWPFAAAVTGTILQVLTDSDVLALLFPWRLSTWLVPLAVVTTAFWVLEQFWPWLEARFSGKVIMAASLSLTFLLAGAGFAKTLVDYGEKKNSSDRPMMAFVTEHKTPGDVYLIPIDMQDFRLETGVPVYVEFKSIPYKDKDVLEWYRRVSTAGSLYRAPSKRTGCQILAQLYAEGTTHAVLPYDHTVKNCPNLEILYVDLNYQVYKITGAEIDVK